MRVETTIQEVLIKALDLPWDHHLFIKPDALTLHDKALVLNDDEEVERDINDEPLYATDRGFKYYVNMQDVQSVVRNAQDQVSECSTKP